LPELLCSNIVYSFHCPGCGARHIGSTFRNLKILISEHRGVSFRTGRPIVKASFSVIRDHSTQGDHLAREVEFGIIFKARYASDLQIAESLSILKDKPALNNNEFSTKLYVIT